MLVAKEHKKVLLNLREPDRVTSIIPGSKVLNIQGHDIVSVPHTLDAVRVLRNIGIQAPSPIRSYYDWPGRFTPFTHQYETAEFCTINPRGYVLNSMGTGKTASVLWAFDYLRKLGKVDWAVVVSPLSTLERVWADEVFRNFADMSYAVVHGTSERRVKLAKGDYDIYIVNHDGVKNKKLLDIFAHKKGVGLVIIDECFPAGTPIDAPGGQRAIETLRIGDMVDTSQGALPVTHVFKKRVNTLVEVEFSNGQKIKCTPDHPFATTSGWVAAKDLKGSFLLSVESVQKLRQYVQREGLPSEKTAEILQQGLFQSGLCQHSDCRDLPPLPESVCKKAVKPKSVLLQTLLRRVARNGGVRSDKAVCRVWSRFFCAVGGRTFSPASRMLGYLCQVVGLAGKTRNNAGRFKEGSAKTEGSCPAKQGQTGVSGGPRQDEVGPRGVDVHARGERYGDEQMRGAGSVYTTERVCLQPRGADQNSQRSRVPDMLQDRLCPSNQEGSVGGGRVKPQYVGETGARQEKAGFAGAVRVESVTHIQLDSPEFVWNLEVSGPHDYIAGGVLVHNCAAFRNASTDRWKYLNTLINGSEKMGYKPKEWVWGLTGTPIPNEPTDAWAQCKMLTPSTVPKYATAFRDQTMTQITSYKWVAKTGALDTVHRAMQPAVRFNREDCIDLPPTTYMDRVVPLTPEQTKIYKEMVTQFKAEYAGGQITAVNEAVKLGRLLQICCGVVYGVDGAITVPAKPRTDTVLEIIEEAEAKVIVFVPFTGALNAVADAIRTEYSVAIVNGEVSKTKRDAIFADFMEPNGVRVLVAQPGTMAHGLSLTSASVIIWYAPINSAEIYQQACARIVRPGQKNNTLIVRVQGSDVERRMYDRLERRQSMQGTLLGMFE